MFKRGEGERGKVLMKKRAERKERGEGEGEEGVRRKGEWKRVSLL